LSSKSVRELDDVLTTVLRAPCCCRINRTLINMSLPDVLAQWVAANLADAPMPTLTIDAPASTQLRSLLPNFTLPSIVVPKISAPLMKLPANFSLPVFMIPIGNRTLQRVLKLVPDLTALPTLMTPRLPEVNISVITSHANVTLPEVSARREAPASSATGCTQPLAVALPD
jgi:hypothetical protein